MNDGKFSKEKRKNLIWIIVALIAVISFFVAKLIGFVDMAQMN